MPSKALISRGVTPLLLFKKADRLATFEALLFPEMPAAQLELCPGADMTKGAGLTVDKPPPFQVPQTPPNSLVIFPSSIVSIIPDGHSGTGVAV